MISPDLLGIKTDWSVYVRVTPLAVVRFFKVNQKSASSVSTCVLGFVSLTFVVCGLDDERWMLQAAYKQT